MIVIRSSGSIVRQPEQPFEHRRRAAATLAAADQLVRQRDLVLEILEVDQFRVDRRDRASPSRGGWSARGGCPPGGCSRSITSAEDGVVEVDGDAAVERQGGVGHQPARPTAAAAGRRGSRRRPSTSRRSRRRRIRVRVSSRPPVSSAPVESATLGRRRLRRHIRRNCRGGTILNAVVLLHRVVSQSFDCLADLLAGSVGSWIGRPNADRHRIGPLPGPFPEEACRARS